MLLGLDKKKLNPKNQTESHPKISIKSDPKLVKYLNGFKILVSRKPKSEADPKFFGYPNLSKSNLYIYIY